MKKNPVLACLTVAMAGLAQHAGAAGMSDLSRDQRIASDDLPIGSGAKLPADGASAVTSNSDTNTLFIAGDGGTSINSLGLAGMLVDPMTLAGRCGALPPWPPAAVCNLTVNQQP